MIWVARLVSLLLLVVPVAMLIAFGVESRANEQPGYDMPGFGLMVYGFLAAVWAGLWLLVHIAVAEVARRRRANHEGPRPGGAQRGASA